MGNSIFGQCQQHFQASGVAASINLQVCNSPSEDVSAVYHSFEKAQGNLECTYWQHVTNTFLRFISAAAWQIVLPLSPLAVLQYVWVVLSLFVCTRRPHFGLTSSLAVSLFLHSFLSLFIISIRLCVSVESSGGVFFFQKIKATCGSSQENKFQTILQKVQWTSLFDDL